MLRRRLSRLPDAGRVADRHRDRRRPGARRSPGARRGAGRARSRQDRILQQCEPRVPHAADADDRADRRGAAVARAVACSGAELESVHRNELRLLKLVNTLLDFSRIEAGRVTARFEPTDLAALTANLASAFRSAIERAGLQLIVDCPPLPQPVYVDREMWEKIVLNLLSNAFKFTFEGSIRVELAADESACRAARARHRRRHRRRRISTASSIASIASTARPGAPTRARASAWRWCASWSSIHGGTIDASSVARRRHRVHRPHAARCGAPAGRTGRRRRGRAGSRARSCHRDGVCPVVCRRSAALAAAPLASRTPTPSTAPDAATARVLVADDNADMRISGAAARRRASRSRRWATARPRWRPCTRQLPDVIVSDVMMPGLDGFELLAALRAHEDTRAIPVILLSARAGEEARIEGLHAGADDYLVKPFTARELVARVEAQLVRVKMRSLEEAHAVRLASVFAQCAGRRGDPEGPRTPCSSSPTGEYLDLIDGRHVVGKTVRDALPELEGQGIFELLDGVYQPRRAVRRPLGPGRSDRRGRIRGRAVLRFRLPAADRRTATASAESPSSRSTSPS